MSGADPGELERLASRIAMLVGDDGEAEAAGRAVGAMARRLGLSGGHLKAIFMAGVGKLGTASKHAADAAARADRLAAEAQGLEHSMEQLEIALHRANRERDRLRDEVERLRTRLETVQVGRQLRVIIGAILLAAVLGGGGFAWFALLPAGGRQPVPPAALASAPDPAAPGEAGLGAVVRASGALVYAGADRASAVRTRLPEGARLVVRQLIWRNFSQWAETRLGGKPGFVPVTDLDIGK